MNSSSRIVHRLETEDGVGAYRANFKWENRPSWIEYMYSSARDFNDDPWPSPTESGIKFDTNTDYSCFATEDQLFEWFFSVYPELVLSDIEIMESVGLKHRAFIVPEYLTRNGHRQSAFQRWHQSTVPYMEESATDFYLRYLSEHNLTGVL